MSAKLLSRPPSRGAIQDVAGIGDDDPIVVLAYKTPMAQRPSAAVFRADLTVSQTLAELLQSPPRDEAAQRQLQQLERETSGDFDVLAVGREGELTKVDPDSTKLADIAVPREVRTRHGMEKMPTASIEVQSYAPVGLRG
jgi:hypothetical protein